MRLVAGELVAGRFRLDHRVGEGGVGVVWAATHVVTRRRAALKFLKASTAAGAGPRRRFLLEARAAGLVEHPNVVTIRDVFDLDDDTPVMVLDLLEGETLAARLEREGALSVEEVASILLPVVSAVGTAHALGIVHRDLKPANVFVCAAGDAPTRVKVLDFGVAKLAAPDGGPTATRSGDLMGTPCYMAPEQALGEKDVDHRVDVWAIGVMAYEALSGGRPIEGETLGQFLQRLMNDAIPPLASVAPDVPVDLAGLVDRMLSRDSAARPADLREVADLLAKHTMLRAPGFGAPASRLCPAADDRIDAPSVGPASSGPDNAARVATRGTAHRRSLPALLTALGVAAAIAVGASMRREPPAAARAPLHAYIAADTPPRDLGEPPSAAASSAATGASVPAAPPATATASASTVDTPSPPTAVRNAHPAFPAGPKASATAATSMASARSPAPANSRPGIAADPPF